MASNNPALEALRRNVTGKVESGEAEAIVAVEEYPRPTLLEEAERLLGYWEQHGDDPEVVAKWAVQDMLGILRFIVEEEA